ncbi:MAG TPA: L-threonine 3-dehydrogenase [Candidatus Acidoferrales bacterium]|nr:L-threonine 3-dehydrogenase [Candidatus Acidoferrales bacterium]
MPAATMKALRKVRPQSGAQLESIAIPTIGSTDVLVRVRAASICGTDLHIYGWDRWSASRIHLPMTFGHEFCGVIETVGDEVVSSKPGDFVSAEMHVNCGHCRPCRMGQPHVCQNLKIIGIDADGCFAEFVRIPARNIWKIDPAIPENYAAILDPLGNAVHTVTAGEIAGQNVLVTGAGPIGLMAIAVARACGCALLVATEVNPHRRELAKTMGADEALDPTQTGIVERVREMTDAGVDVLLEMSGSPQAIRQGFQMLRQGGRASLLGIPKDDVTLDLVNDVIFKGATVQGIYGRRMFETWVHMTELLKHNRLNLDPLFRERLPLEKFENAFSLLESGQAGKVLFYPNGSPK